ncbi:MAG TPA: RagB/SusD family nutrient uptake outer membrane protein [Saprospiraceae bacterium]|nr:RagB/SusD family nutrient uptake outer membrane protein [Saprospiraceae bacterium]HPN69555.1 RagB/SusD family nutrient uptake outer membrane protein [Saprospiraceae bacterium]
MIRKIKYISLLCSSLFVMACTDILDKDPIAIFDAGSYFQTEEDATQAINAAYRSLPFSNKNDNFYWAFSAITSDEAITAGDGSRAGLTELDALNYTPRTEEFNAFWKLQYNGITQCNVVLDNIDNIDIQAAKKDRIKGEALFLRAYYYFLLTQVFGDVPFMTSVLSPDELKIPKTSKTAIYEKIVADCETAASFLPVTYPATETGRVSKGAALGLAAKIALYQKNYQEVVRLVTAIKGLNVYALVADYEDNFRKNTQNNSESVWEIQHNNLESDLGNFLNQWLASRKIIGYGFGEITQEYVNLFETGDPRLKFTVAMNNDPYFGVVFKNSFASTKYGPRKYLQADAEVTQKGDGDINYTFIRYAEVLLWEAEALNELGSTAAAAIPLDMVRARARAQSSIPTVLPAITTTDQATMRNAIRNERAVELGYEGHRFFDLVRWGIAAEVLEDFIVGKHEVFPIPQTEIDLNPQLLQNPGY